MGAEETFVREAAETALAGLGARFEQGQVRVLASESHEISAEHGEVKMLRTTEDLAVDLKAVDGARAGTTNLNRGGADDLAEALDSLSGIVAAAEADDANRIVEAQPESAFAIGPDAPDYDAMVETLQTFMAWVSRAHPSVIVRDLIVTFRRRTGLLLSTQGTRVRTDRRGYDVSFMAAARDGEKMSSLQYTGFETHALDRPLVECGRFEELVRQCAEQVETKPVPGKFTGDVIIAPSALADFVGFLAASVGDQALVSDTSIYKDKLGEQVAGDVLTVRFTPLGEETADGYWTTGDGYLAADSTFVEAGRLNHFMLSDYGARKTGRKRAPNAGGCMVVEPGECSRDELLGEVKEGILLTRFSGGRPNSRGDVSGIAKNSYYIRDGRVQYPVSETMISGNMAQVLMAIQGVSAERVDFGDSLLPWVRASGVTVS